MECSVSREITMQSTCESSAHYSNIHNLGGLATESGSCTCQKQIRKSVKFSTPNGQKQTPDSYLIGSAQMSQSKNCTFKVMWRLLA